MSETTFVPTKLLWVDLEMTGLNPEKHVIIEIAAEVTDTNYKTLGSYEALVRQPDETLAAMDPWPKRQHAESGLTDRVRSEGKPEDVVRAELAAFIAEHFGEEPATLAGNSIHNDRAFMKQWWPEIDALLHYRMLDVSSFKIVMQTKYGVMFQKREVHRAFDDIQASIAELQYYLDWCKSHGDEL